MYDREMIQIRKLEYSLKTEFMGERMLRLKIDRVEYLNFLLHEKDRQAASVVKEIEQKTGLEQLIDSVSKEYETDVNLLKGSRIKPQEQALLIAEGRLQAYRKVLILLEQCTEKKDGSWEQ